jgi:uncharacterized membrane protein
MLELALFIHILGVALVFAGGAIATVADLLARRRTRPSEIALLLAGARWGAVVLVVGLVVTVGAGFWLVDQLELGFDQSWLKLSLLGVVVATLAGAAGGRTPRHARELANRLAAADDHPSPDLDRLLHSRLAVSLNIVAGAAMVAVLALMIWKPV